MIIAPHLLQKAVLVGMGNIGSHVVELLARMFALTELSLVDHDAYEAKNVTSQSISPGDVGRNKALVQKDRAALIDPNKRVQAFANRIEHVPLGALRDRVLIGCLDSLSARQALSQRAWWSGSLYFDTGIHVSANLARVTMYVPGDQSACLECLWDRRHYAELDNLYTCQQATTKPTEAPARLGALVAALVVGELEKLFDDPSNPTLASQEMVFDAASRVCHTTRLTRQSTCLFPHQTLELEEAYQDPEAMTLGEAFSLGSRGNPHGKLSVPGIPWIIRGLCQSCQRVHGVLALSGRMERPLCCPDCQVPFDKHGLQFAENVAAADLSRGQTDLPLCRIGFQRGDVFTVLNHDRVARHFELKGAATSPLFSPLKPYHLHV